MFGRRLRARAAFTLVELLVVLAIVSILMAMLLPSLSKAREHAYRTKCLNNIRQIGIGLQVYLNDYAEFPPADAGAPSAGKGPLKPVFFADRRSGLLALRATQGFDRNFLACPDGWASAGADEFYDSQGISKYGTAYMDYAYWVGRYPPGQTFDVRSASFKYRQEKGTKILVTDIVTDVGEPTSLVGQGNHGSNHQHSLQVVPRTDGQGHRLKEVNKIQSAGSSVLFSDYHALWFPAERLSQQVTGMCYPPVDRW